MPEEKFPLPKCSYESLIKIIQSYAHQTGEVHRDEVSKVAGMAPGEVSRNVRFLVDVGLLEGGKKKSISDKGRNLSHALDYQQPEVVSTIWRDIVSANDFLQKLVFAVKIRKGMDPSTLVTHVAYSAGQPKNTKTMAGAGAVIEIIKQAGLIKEEDGKLVAVPLEEAPVEPPAAPQEYAPSAEIELRGAGQIAPAPVRAGKPAVSLNIQIQIHCSSTEVEGLAPKIRSLIRELSQQEDVNESKAGE
jgi:hypothetical protein